MRLSEITMTRDLSTSYNLEVTHSPMPAQTKVMPIQVSLVMTLRSAHHSPKTVNKKAKLFVIGTVRDSSKNSVNHLFCNTASRQEYVHRNPMGLEILNGYRTIEDKSFTLLIKKV